jgi:hypothetical protein
MRTHIIENGVVTNTIAATVEDAQTAFPSAICIEATYGGIGWAYANGELVTPAPVSRGIDEINAPILAALAVIDAKTPRAVREAFVTGDNSRVIALENSAAELRAQLVRVS